MYIHTRKDIFVLVVYVDSVSNNMKQTAHVYCILYTKQWTLAFDIFFCLFGGQATSCARSWAFGVVIKILSP